MDNYHLAFCIFNEKTQIEKEYFFDWVEYQTVDDEFGNECFDSVIPKTGIVEIRDYKNPNDEPMILDLTEDKLHYSKKDKKEFWESLEEEGFRLFNEVE